MTVPGSVTAFQALAQRLRHGADCPPLAAPPLERLRLALDDPRATPMDRAVLLRHALRFQSLRDGVERQLAGDLPTGVLQEVGLEARPGAGGRNLAALPWRPTWLPGAGQSVDETAMRAERRRFADGDGVPGDPFLHSLGRASYRSVGQRAAVRATLTMPPGALLVVDLPTGEGKSTVFAAIERIGFASDPPGHPRGTTLVIVPTVTLALDHERSANSGQGNPLAYVGRQAERNAAIRAAIEADAQGLCFASPEAAVGPLLRSCLGRAAKRGTLRAVVVDEAHLVEGWGTGFRTEFQTFAGVCRAWAETCPPPLRFRTVLLSATLSGAAEQTLADLFAPGEALPVVSAARVRPEIEFWAAAPCSPDERDARVREAVARLPRPAILYVTTVADAEAWFARLKAAGYGRMRLVHGGTSADERGRVLELWSAGQLDLVVATSAFGLGVDYAHVRAVLHACVPESFDRFYQEAGRAGRDGCAAASIVVPASTDFPVAKRLAAKAVIGVDRGLERWQAMFRHPGVLQHGHPRYGVRLDVAPSHSLEDIDMVGERSADWNARTLALMARAGLLRLGGVPSEPDGEAAGPPRLDVEVCDEGHLERPAWNAKVELKRAEIATAASASLSMMRTFLVGRECPGQLVCGLYAAEGRRVAAACGGCGLCRTNPAARVPDELVGDRPPPWPAQGDLAPPLSEAWGGTRRLLVTYPTQEPPKRDIQDIGDAVRRLDAWGMRVFAAVAAPPDWLCGAIHQAVVGRPWLAVADGGFPARWPRGARLAAFGPGMALDQGWLRADAADAGMILLVPDGMRDAARPSRTIAEFAPCPSLSLQEFLGKILR